jgi:hypothetical protein
LYDLDVGDPVVMTHSYGRKGSERGYVVKKGRKLITVQPEGTDAEHLKLVFRMEDGSHNDRDFPYRHHVYTVEDYADREYRSHLVVELKSKGIRIDGYHKFPTEVLERLVKALDGWEAT